MRKIPTEAWSLIAAVALGLTLGSGCSKPSEPDRLDLSFLTAAPGTPTGSTPRITAYTPDHGPVTAGSFLLVEGSGYLPTTKAIFGTFASGIWEDALVTLYISGTQLVVVVPSYFAGKADLAVYNSSTEYDYRLQAFTYQ